MLPKEILKDHEFSEKYRQIIGNLGFSFEEDIKARDYLHEVLQRREQYTLENVLHSIKSLIQNDTLILVFGGGPDAAQFMQWLNEIATPPYFNINSVLIVAIDGATELLARYALIPDLIFTDLDGLQLSTAEKQEYNRTYFVIHAHGDNQQKISEFESLIRSKNVVGTTQSSSRLPVINSGGFTDGDRALYFLENFLHPSHSLYLIGYDFSPTVGGFSKPFLTEDTPASVLKKRKLDYGAQLTRDFCKRSGSKIQFLEYLHSFTLRSELAEVSNCGFQKFQSKYDIEKIFSFNQLYLKEK